MLAFISNTRSNTFKGGKPAKLKFPKNLKISCRKPKLFFCTRHFDYFMLSWVHNTGDAEYPIFRPF